GGGVEGAVVVVAGVREATGPDLRLRGSLLGRDDLVQESARGELLPFAGPAAGQDRRPGQDAAAAALASKLLDEERRLFYVAVTRARRALVVTAGGGVETGPPAGALRRGATEARH